MDLSTFKHIVILSGAGVSVESGIPDYRSPTGIFAKLGMECFTRKYREDHPELLEHPEYLAFREQMSSAIPNDSHFLAKFLHDRGILVRVITQNVDGIYQKTGLPESMVIEFHGSFSKGTTVLYGDSIPKNIIVQTAEDMAICDCVIIMGTSLRVIPFAVVPNLAKKKCVRILVDKNAIELVNSFTKLQEPFSYNGPIKFDTRMVSTQQKWTRTQNSKWRHQYVVQELCGVWARQCMEKMKDESDAK